MEDEHPENTEELLSQFDTIYHTLSLFKMQMTNVQKMVKSLEKDVKKELKNTNSKKTGLPKKKREPSGFAKPTKISDELCEFMDVPIGSEIARTEVTKALVNYVKEHNLVQSNTIIPDEKLNRLLGEPEVFMSQNITLNYFNIQKYMNKHFISG
jgi:chromatin remodeling complex protein RSC6